MSNANHLEVWNRLIDDSSHCLIIAEVGLNHNGNLDLALESIRAAAKSGANAVKFQNYRTEDFLFDNSINYTYMSQGKEITESMWDLCKRCEITTEWLPILKKLCDTLGVIFLSTPTSESGVDDLIRHGVQILKNGSDYLTHIPLLIYMGSTGKPVIISTGMADVSDISDAIAAIRAGGGDKIVLLHCTSSYPTEEADVNLRKIVALRKHFALPVGFSDHTIGSQAAVQAVTLGAIVIEKHFTLDHSLPGPDHWFSASPKEFSKYVNEIRNAELRLGNESILPIDVEIENRKEFRLSLIAAKNLSIGQKLTKEDLVISKPGTGLAPKECEKLIGREIKQAVERGTPLQWEHFN